MLMTAAFPVTALCQVSYHSPDVQVAAVSFATPVLPSDVLLLLSV